MKDRKRKSIVHRIKCTEPYFSEQWNGIKAFEFRKMDRPYRVGDYIMLEQWLQGTDGLYRGGSYMLLRITTILLEDGPAVPLPPNHAILGTKVIARSRHQP